MVGCCERGDELLFPYNVGDNLTNQGIVSFSRRVLVRGVSYLDS